MGIIVAVVLVFVVLALNAGGKKVKVGTVSTQVDVGTASDLAARVEKDHAPIGLNDLADGGRPVWLQHTGPDAEKGWTAFDAAPNGCATTFDREHQQLVDCNGKTYPSDGTGLARYPVHVDSGHLVLDLNPDGDSTTTSTEQSTTTTILITGG